MQRRHAALCALCLFALFAAAATDAAAAAKHFRATADHFNEYATKAADHRKKLWTLLVLQLWLAKHKPTIIP